MLEVHVAERDNDRVSAFVRGVVPRGDFHLWFSMQNGRASGGDPLIAALLPVAMTLGKYLMIDAPVSPALLQQTTQIQKLWSTWYGWKPVKILADEAAVRQDTAGVGCFSLLVLTRSIRY